MSAPWWDSDWEDRSGPEYRVHVGNLAWGTDERSLKDAFADYGPRSAEPMGPNEFAQIVYWLAEVAEHRAGPLLKAVLDDLGNIVYDRETGRSRGFGFVNFDDNKSMSDAIQGMNSQELGGRSITVNQANHRGRKWRA